MDQNCSLIVCPQNKVLKGLSKSASMWRDCGSSQDPSSDLSVWSFNQSEKGPDPKHHLTITPSRCCLMHCFLLKILASAASCGSIVCWPHRCLILVEYGFIKLHTQPRPPIYHQPTGRVSVPTFIHCSHVTQWHPFPYLHHPNAPTPQQPTCQGAFCHSQGIPRDYLHKEQAQVFGSTSGFH